MKEKWWVLFILLILAVTLFFTTRTEDSGEQGVKPEDYCESDSDCVPATFCHPTDCVIRSKAQDPAGIFCTQVCQPGTLDCGQGSCICDNNKCGAKFNELK